MTTNKHTLPMIPVAEMQNYPREQPHHMRHFDFHFQMHNTILYIAESDARGFIYRAVVVSPEQLNLNRGAGTPPRSPQSQLLAQGAPPPVPCVHHPEDDGQHDAGGDDDEADVDVPAVLLEAGAVVVGDGRERLPHEGAVLQLHQERAELVQALADARRRRHLAVRRRRDAPRRGAHLRPRRPRGLALEPLPLPRRAVEVDLAGRAPARAHVPVERVAEHGHEGARLVEVERAET